MTTIHDAWFRSWNDLGRASGEFQGDGVIVAAVNNQRRRLDLLQESGGSRQDDLGVAPAHDVQQAPGASETEKRAAEHLVARWPQLEERICSASTFTEGQMDAEARLHELFGTGHGVRARPESRG